MSRWTVVLIGLCLLFGLQVSRSDAPMRLRVIGGLATAGQYERLEKKFWHSMEALSGGRVTAEIFPSDQSGLNPNEVLQLMRLGVVTFGTVLLLQVDQPELSVVDLPALSPDMTALRKSVAAYRPHLEAILRSKFGIKLLAIYTYPAQEIFCTAELDRLSDLAGRTVRTSSMDQSVLMSALGAKPLILPFDAILPAVQSGVVNCAITGTMSGSEIHLSAATSSLYPLAVNWGVSLFGVNLAAWERLPDDLQKAITKGLNQLEQDIWAAADQDTLTGIACDTGNADCPDGQKPGRMKLAHVTRADDAKRRRLFIESVLPAWIHRCGAPCVRLWNETLAPAVGISASEG